MTTAGGYDVRPSTSRRPFRHPERSRRTPAGRRLRGRDPSTRCAPLGWRRPVDTTFSRRSRGDHSVVVSAAEGARLNDVCAGEILRLALLAQDDDGPWIRRSAVNLTATSPSSSAQPKDLGSTSCARARSFDSLCSLRMTAAGGYDVRPSTSQRPLRHPERSRRTSAGAACAGRGRGPSSPCGRSASRRRSGRHSCYQTSVRRRRSRRAAAGKRAMVAGSGTVAAQASRSARSAALLAPKLARRTPKSARLTMPSPVKSPKS